jgi:hypothetical protein
LPVRGESSGPKPAFAGSSESLTAGCNDDRDGGFERSRRETTRIGLVDAKARKILREIDHPGESYCGDSVYGDHWYGPTRLSLIDTGKHEILNTIEVPDFFEHPGDGDSFPIPFFVPNDFYDVPNPNSKNEGTPKILNLRDLTGDGYPGQFVLFEYEFCGTPLTSVLGYSRVSDRAVQYQVEVLRSNDMPSLDTWVATIFGRQPVSLGYWDFTWEPGHGANRKIHEQVSFDPASQLFVDRQEDL